MKNRFATICIIGVLAGAICGCTTAGDAVDSNIQVENSDTAELNTDMLEEVADGSYEGGSSVETSEDTGSVDENDVVPEFKIELENGTYMVDFDTDSSMFHVNEAMNGKARLTVKDRTARLYLVMPSKNVLNLYEGLAENAGADEANVISPVTELVTYDDGITEEVFAFYVPVYVMDEEFDLALIGKKEIWYDHKVSISNPELIEDGSSTIQIELEGGSGRAYIESPVKLTCTEDGYIATLVWSSKNYDYMIVEEEKYLPIFVDEHSVFEIPVADLGTPLSVIADTTAMSEPHEIEYVITFIEATLY